MSDPVTTANAGAREQEVVVQRPAGPLVGTLLLPGGNGPVPVGRAAAGVWALGPGQQRSPDALGITKSLAEALAAGGVASYRFDKRGVGASPGDWRRPGLWDGADDARAALQLLADRPEVDPSRIVLLGHSEGAVLAAAIAAADPTSLAGVVLLSRPHEPVRTCSCGRRSRPRATVPAPVRLVLRLLRTDLVAAVRKNHARIRTRPVTSCASRASGPTPDGCVSSWRTTLARTSADWRCLCWRCPAARTCSARPRTSQGSLSWCPARSKPISSRTSRTCCVPSRTRGPCGTTSRRCDSPVDPRVLRLVVDWTVRTTAGPRPQVEQHRAAGGG
jgi:pimeloyl-ACP methyl ester carboxylesterase